MKNIGIVLFPNFQLLDLAVMTVFEVANSELNAPFYKLSLVSETGGMVRSSVGSEVGSEAFGAREWDTLLVAGWLTPQIPSVPLLEYLRSASAASRRTASICTGAFLLAEANLLDGLRVTTHWHMARDLQRQYPKLKVQENKIFIRDGALWTSAGMTSCIDLAIALVEQDLGVDIAKSIAKKLVVYHRRPGGQSQYSVLLDLAPKSDRIQDALTYAKNNLRKALSVEDLAEAAHLSPRQFSRVFRAETGQSPARAIEHLRIESAKLMLETENHSIDIVARESGFADPERMRRAFIRQLGQPPQVFRRAVQQQKIHTELV